MESGFREVPVTARYSPSPSNAVGLPMIVANPWTEHNSNEFPRNVSSDVYHPPRLFVRFKDHGESCSSLELLDGAKERQYSIFLLFLTININMTINVYPGNTNVSTVAHYNTTYIDCQNALKRERCKQYRKTGGILPRAPRNRQYNTIVHGMMLNLNQKRSFDSPPPAPHNQLIVSSQNVLFFLMTPGRRTTLHIGRMTC